MVTRLLLLAAALTQAQSFDIATVKLSPPPQGDRIDINLGTFRDGTLTLANVTLSDAIKFAYELVSDEQLSGPEWLRTIRFDIVAQAPPSISPAELHRRTQVLLGERLRVVLRREQKTLPHLALVVARGGPKVLRASRPQLPGSQVRGRINHNQMPMALLASLLSRFERQTVVDLTGLQGEYEVRLDWAPDNSLAAAQPDAPPPDRPNLFEAVQQQLGLKLESRRAPLDVLVVVQASQVPAEN